MNQRVFGSSSAIAVSAPSSTTRRERGDRSDSPVEVRHGTDRQNPKTTAKTAPRSPQHPRDYRSRGSRLTANQPARWPAGAITLFRLDGTGRLATASYRGCWRPIAATRSNHHRSSVPGREPFSAPTSTSPSYSGTGRSSTSGGRSESPTKSGIRMRVIAASTDHCMHSRPIGGRRADRGTVCTREMNNLPRSPVTPPSGRLCRPVADARQTARGQLATHAAVAGER